MNPLIDYTYFIDKCEVANVFDTSTVGTSIQKAVARYIARYQVDYLTKLLGLTLYNQYVAGMAVAHPATKWTALTSQIVDATNKISPLAHYVWYWWYRDHTRAKTAMGTGQPTGQNLTIVIDDQLVCDNWAEMIRLNDIIDTFIVAHPTDYPDYVKDTDLYEYLNTFGL